MGCFSEVVTKWVFWLVGVFGFFFFKIYPSISARAQVEGVAEGEMRESQAEQPVEGRADPRAQSNNHEITAQAETTSQMLNGLSHQALQGYNKILKLRVMVAQHCECVQCHWTVHLKMVSRMLCKFHLD